MKDLLGESPSLKHELNLKVEYAYQKKAVLIVMKETGFSRSTFPKECPFDFDQCLRANFYPN